MFFFLFKRIKIGIESLSHSIQGGEVMDPIIVVTILGGTILLLLLLGAPLKPLQLFGQGMIKLIIGALFLFFLNAFGSAFDYSLPINFVTAAISGFLGIPGLLLLMAVDLVIL